MTSSNNQVQEYLSKIETLILDGQLFKITFSKPRAQKKDIQNVYLKTAEIKHQLQYSLTYRYKTKDEVKNYKKEDISHVIQQLLNESFLNAVLFTEEEETSILQNKKGSSTMFTKKTKENNLIIPKHPNFFSIFKTTFVKIHIPG